MRIQFLEGKPHLSYVFEKISIFTYSIESYDPQMTEQAQVDAAMAVRETVLANHCSEFIAHPCEVWRRNFLIL